MAELFLARRVGPGAIAHPVVIKRLLPEMQADPDAAHMFRWEAWISARLRHPNIVRFHDFVTHGGRYHLVMEHVPGCDLAIAMRRRAATGQPFPIPEAIEIGMGLLRALGHAHALPGDDGPPIGLVHGDVSPHNVLLSLEGEVKLTDFGVSRPTRLAAHEEGELIKGTPGYLAPELLLGRPADARADLFAVGVILFELLVGRRLFQGQDDTALLRAALSVEVPAIAPLRAACPALLEEVVRRALAREPDQRFESAAEMEEALGEVLASLREPPAARGAGRGIAALVREAAAEAPARGAQPRPPVEAGGVRLPRAPAPLPDRDRPTLRPPARGTEEGPAPGLRRRAPWALLMALAFAAGAFAATAPQRRTPR
jgi:serine/threonine-protein kinase